MKRFDCARQSLAPLNAKGIMVKYLLGEKLYYDWKIVTITIVSTLVLMVDYYHRLTLYKYWDRVILYLVIPLILIIFIFRENPK